MSNNQEYQNIAEECFWNRINTILDNYFKNTDYTYIVNSENFTNYSSSFQTISNKEKIEFNAKQIQSINNIIDNINNRIKEIYNEVYNKEIKIEIKLEWLNKHDIKIITSIETNNEYLHDILVAVFIQVISVSLCNYIRYDESGRIFMFKNMRKRIYWRSIRYIAQLAEEEKLPNNIAIKLTDILRYILFSKSLKEISNDLVLGHVDIDCSKKPKPELTLQPEDSEDTNYSPQ